jgi:hypothetical protein
MLSEGERNDRCSPNAIARNGKPPARASDGPHVPGKQAIEAACGAWTMRVIPVGEPRSRIDAVELRVPHRL